MKQLIFGSALLLSLAACSSDDPVQEPDGPDVPEKNVYFNVALQTSVVGTTETYVQALTQKDMMEGEISFNKYGFEIPSTRAARIYASQDGKFLYDQDYGGGTVTKFETSGGENYTQVAQINVNPTVGTNYPGWKMISEDKGFVHHVVTENLFEDEKDPTSYTYTETTATIAEINLKDMTLGNSSTFVVPRSETDVKENLYVWRIDAPFIAHGKAYFGLSKRGGNPANPDQPHTHIEFPPASVVVDYPSLKNPKMIESKVGEGSTYGFRIPAGHLDEKGDVYQTCKTHVLKITNGEYDASYDFDLSKALGFPVKAQGWFYAGNGIGYATCFDAVKGDSEKAAAWFVARIDVYNKTAIKMNIPGGLYLFMYQRAKVVDGKVYMAICPVGGDGNVYIFDPKKADPNGYELGAKLKTGAGATYIGIY